MFVLSLCIWRKIEIFVMETIICSFFFFVGIFMFRFHFFFFFFLVLIEFLRCLKLRLTKL